MDSLNQPGRPLCYPNSCQDHLRIAKVSWQIGSESLGREPVTAQIRNSSTNFTSHNLSVRFQGRVPKIFTRHEPKTRQYLKAWKVLKIPVGICFSPSEITMWNEIYLKYVKYVKLKKSNARCKFQMKLSEVQTPQSPAALPPTHPARCDATLGIDAIGRSVPEGYDWTVACATRIGILQTWDGHSVPEILWSLPFLIWL